MKIRVNINNLTDRTIIKMAKDLKCPIEQNVEDMRGWLLENYKSESEKLFLDIKVVEKSEGEDV